MSPQIRFSQKALILSAREISFLALVSAATVTISLSTTPIFR